MVNLAEWLSVHLQSKWLWFRVPLVAVSYFVDLDRNYITGHSLQNNAKYRFLDLKKLRCWVSQGSKPVSAIFHLHK